MAILTIRLALTAHQTPTSLGGAGLHGLDVDSVNFSCDYFVYLHIPANETTLHRKRMSTADRSHLRRQAVETIAKINPAAWIARLQGVRRLRLFLRV